MVVMICHVVHFPRAAPTNKKIKIEPFPKAKFAPNRQRSLPNASPLPTTNDWLLVPFHLPGAYRTPGSGGKLLVMTIDGEGDPLTCSVRVPRSSTTSPKSPEHGHIFAPLRRGKGRLRNGW